MAGRWGIDEKEGSREGDSLAHDGVETKEHPNTPVSQLYSGEFITWLENNSPGHLRFKSPITGVRYDIDMWFDDEFKIPGR
jgi:hypothetical protein